MRLEDADPINPADFTLMGLDPGLADLGWGVIQVLRGTPRYVAHGVISTEAHGDPWERVQEIVGEVCTLTIRYNVHRIGAENWVFYGKKQQTTNAHVLGLVLGGLLCGLPAPLINGGSAQDWRAALGLGRKVSKPEARVEVMRRLHLKKKPTPLHASDALAVALATVPKALGPLTVAA